jgi:CP family cyanate transporter-like MFS transporter
MHENGADVVERPSLRTTTLVFLAGFCLQSGMFLIGPLLPDIANDLGLSGVAAGIMTGIPPLMMGLFAIPGGLMTARWSGWRVVGLGLIVIGLTGALRGVVPSTWAVIVATIGFGSAIGLAQPAGPTYLRARFPNQVGSMTSLYTFGLVSGVIVASGLAGPVLAPLAHGWRGALICWGMVGILVGAAWLILATKPAYAAEGAVAVTAPALA